MTDEFPHRPCLRSGMCCKKAPCPFGEWNAARGQCRFLEVAFKDGDVEVHSCGKYAEIAALPPEAGAEFSPAFGSGCCMPLFNEARARNAEALRSGRIPLAVLDPRPATSGGTPATLRLVHSRS